MFALILSKIAYMNFNCEIRILTIETFAAADDKKTIITYCKFGATIIFNHRKNYIRPIRQYHTIFENDITDFQYNVFDSYANTYFKNRS